MITERHVQAIWYDRAFRPSALYTRRGTPLAVVDPGAWNLGPGPDFLGAVLEVGKERRRDVPSWLPAEDLSAPVQGLIGIHRDFCLQVHPDCDACRLLEDRI